MCIYGCILTCIYDYTFELGIPVFLHALIHMPSIHFDGALLFSCIVATMAASMPCSQPYLIRFNLVTCLE